ncbi:excinuclease ABC subunit A [Pseudoclavibacter sp. RFBJ3]|uniref:excinuclease ABC subunit A n=1 Tax=unclassified Pseudoclavibacter TaxID=2615177 RepID=UPI000CE813AE|nr:MULTISPECIES: excinuclease ABC subunit A [unclassified Pseudoclavibacter]PPF87524.1 excinuclease ABC subunit A [Pseudoclavibacter sp. RFBJ5]PPF90374.1 excinuclease ABC subunit A [Pseudoclavibacter sp. RFBJ3]PPG01059.1 excinuclease ABC subunit A [Pseudoclavibacter sp. RFBH5]PPG26162.1 excinuclease ABC subunit A [Pseudoclavibacter sp. RFBI4]
MSEYQPTSIKVRGARVHNLKNVDVDVPLGQLVAIAGVSGSGKSSLALGVLYAEGSRRYVEALSTYTRRRMSHATRATVDSVHHVPAALALRQRPSMPGVRSTFGTSTELLNVLRVMFSRLGSHVCPNGHRLAPTIDVAANKDLVCPECGAIFYPPGAESLAFNSDGACPVCTGTGTVRDVDDAALVPDASKTIEGGAVAPWGMFGLAVMPQVVAELGVRIDVPYRELTEQERQIVVDGEAVKREIRVPSKSGKLFDLDFTYRSARQAVREAINNASSEAGLTRVSRFITTYGCTACHGSRLSDKALGSEVDGINLAQAAQKNLEEVLSWVSTIPNSVDLELRPMASLIAGQFAEMGQRLVQLGLGYLTLDRASSTLSTGERQRVQLARAVRNETTGVLYVLDEPSIGLHPANIDGLIGVMRDLLRDGNSVVLVDHDVQVLREADWMIEIGPGSGAAGGTVLAQGTISTIAADPVSLIGEFLSGRAEIVTRVRKHSAEVFADGAVRLATSAVHTVRPLEVSIPKGRLTAVTGMSGSGKTTLVLDSLVPAITAAHEGTEFPPHVRSIDAAGLTSANVVDATPIGANVRSTVATYSGVLDDLRRLFASTPIAREEDLKAGDFSYNTGSLKCPRCEGTGQIVLDVQFLPDVDIPCPDCHGTRYRPAADIIRIPTGTATNSLPELLSATVADAAELLADHPRIAKKLQTLVELGLGYLTLGEDTPALSGGEAQRLKLATELGRKHTSTLFILDEPSVGLHPLDTRVLLAVIDRLLSTGATVIIIEHDLDMIANADHVIDLGPGGGTAGGRIVATGSPEGVSENPDSVTGRYLARFSRNP